MYTIINSTAGNPQSIIHCSTSDDYIPFDTANTDYQKVLDAIIEQGADCFEGDIPEDLQAAADAKQKEDKY